MPEYAFIGRSNVGKSSLINMLTERRQLAKTSSTPGKTQLINHFLINDSWYLVDLPGYGFAKVSKTEKEKWKQMITAYLSKRDNLMLVFLLIDSRIPMQEIDSKFMCWMGESKIPFVIVFTKTDKLKRMEVEKNINDYKTALYRYWEELPPVFITSAEKKLGQEDLRKYIEETNLLFKSTV
jgi:GTP-binding protein